MALVLMWLLVYKIVRGRSFCHYSVIKTSINFREPERFFLMNNSLIYRVKF